MNKKITDLENKLTQLTSELNELKSELTELKTPDRWRPKLGEFYYSINTDGKVIETFWDGHFWNEDRYAIGNYFKTKEEAEFEIERLKVLAEMREFAEPEDRLWNGDNYHYHIYYDYCGNELYISWTRNIRGDGMYFESQEKAQQCIASVGKERIKKYYIGIKQ
jgi:hypothetical protein